jgi:hypothetical protein
LEPPITYSYIICNDVSSAADWQEAANVNCKQFYFRFLRHSSISFRQECEWSFSEELYKHRWRRLNVSFVYEVPWTEWAVALYFVLMQRVCSDIIFGFFKEPFLAKLRIG